MHFSLERMSQPALHVRRIFLALGVFVVIVLAGSLAVGEMCFPAQSHVPASPWCNLGLFSPAFASVVSGVVFGWRQRIHVSILGVLVPIFGLGLLFLSGHLHYWFGQALGPALQHAIVYCLLPSAIASIASAILFSRRGANAL
jgi:hypothetical protein